MAVRNYDTPDPARVVANIKKVLATRNMELLSRGSYELLITHCGFIAHYDHAGFISTYKDDMVGFVGYFLEQNMWERYLANHSSYLYDVSYKGKILADIVRELIAVFKEYQPAVEAAQRDRKHNDAERQLLFLAESLGYKLVKKEE